MRELFLSKELSILAKEKGFDEECFAIYDDDFHLSYWLNQQSFKNSDADKKEECTAPLYDQIIDWLLEKHNISICPLLGTDMRWVIDFVPNTRKTHIASGNFTYFTGNKRLTNELMGFETKYKALDFAIKEAFKLV